MSAINCKGDKWGWIPGRGRDLSLHYHIQTSSGAHLASYLVSTEGLSPQVKWSGHEIDSSLPSNAKVKNAWSYAPTPPYIFMVW